MKIYSIHPFILIISLQLNAFSQNIHTSEKDVFKSKGIVFYGYDFSHFKLADAGRQKDENIKKVIPSWIALLNEHTDANDLQSRFKKDTVIFDFDYTQGLINKIEENQLLSDFKHLICKDSIQLFINDYKINEKEGIGFVVFVECFEKSTKLASAYFTFFDIASKKILVCDYFSANGVDGYGLTKYWGSGLNETFAKYIRDVYRKKLKAS